jgi:hypothetical protein
MMDKPMRVTVFGGSAPRPGDPPYEEALELGSLLGAQSWTVITGGYVGTMEAVSRAAAERGAHVIGVTCAEIENWREVKPNPWVHEEQRYPTLRTRLMALIDGCDAAVALPGGVGTLTEVSTMWNHLLTEAIHPRPLLLVGARWQVVIRTFLKSMHSYVPDSQRKWAICVPDVRVAVDLLQEWQSNGKV